MCKRCIDRSPLVCPTLGTWRTTQARALTGNQTSNLSVQRPVLNPLSHTSQGSRSALLSEILKSISGAPSISCWAQATLKRRTGSRTRQSACVGVGWNVPVRAAEPGHTRPPASFLRTVKRALLTPHEVVWHPVQPSDATLQCPGETGGHALPQTTVRTPGAQGWGGLTAVMSWKVPEGGVGKGSQVSGSLEILPLS